jgi:hypothetical protein
VRFCSIVARVRSFVQVTDHLPDRGEEQVACFPAVMRKKAANPDRFTRCDAVVRNWDFLDAADTTVSTAPRKSGTRAHRSDHFPGPMQG